MRPLASFIPRSLLFQSDLRSYRHYQRDRHHERSLPILNNQRGNGDAEEGYGAPENPLAGFAKPRENASEMSVLILTRNSSFCYGTTNLRPTPFISSTNLVLEPYARRRLCGPNACFLAPCLRRYDHRYDQIKHDEQDDNACQNDNRNCRFDSVPFLDCQSHHRAHIKTEEELADSANDREGV